MPASRLYPWGLLRAPIMRELIDHPIQPGLPAAVRPAEGRWIL